MSLISAESDSAREVEVWSDGGTRDSTDSGSEDYVSGGELGDEYERFLSQLMDAGALSAHKRGKP